jgi:hypothetical protein
MVRAGRWAWSLVKDLGATIIFVPDLPANIRTKWNNDPIRGAEWRVCLTEFDSWMGQYAVVLPSIAAEHGEPAGNMTDMLETLNKNEPRTVADLSQAYDVLNNFAGRLPTVSFIVTTGPNKTGAETNMCPNQNLKLFMQTSADTEYPAKEFCIAHMNGAFLSKKKSKDMVEAGVRKCVA